MELELMLQTTVENGKTLPRHTKTTRAWDMRLTVLNIAVHNIPHYSYFSINGINTTVATVLIIK